MTIEGPEAKIMRKYMTNDVIFVQGHPLPKGSMRSIGFHDDNGMIRSRVIPDKRVLMWEDMIRAAIPSQPPWPKDLPVTVSLLFLLPRPQASAYCYPVRGDIDKLTRAVLDALTGYYYIDDTQVVNLYASKKYIDAELGEQVGVQIAVWLAT